MTHPSQQRPQSRTENCPLQTAYINRVATAVPPYDVHDAFRRFTQSLFRHDRRNSLLFERMAGKSGIEHRYSCFAPSNLPEGDSVDAEGFRQKLIDNIVGIAKAGRAFGLPIVHSTVNVKTGLNKPAIPHLRKVLGDLPTIDRTSINAWKDSRVRTNGQCYRSQETNHDGVVDGGLP